MNHWSNRYIGIKYSDEFDCGDLVEQVQNEQFNRGLHLPTRTKNKTQMISDYKDQFVASTDTPIEGDLVLMETVLSHELHLGVLIVINTIKYVLHNSRTAQSTIITKASQLKGIGLRLNGFYQWK